MNKENIKKEILDFITWIKTIKSTKYHGTTSYLKKLSKVFMLTSENFRESKTNLWTSTLSFYSIFSMVPILAIIFSIAKLLGFQELIQKEVIKAFPLDEDSFDYIFDFTSRLLDSTREDFLAIVAFISLLWAIIKIFSLIENSFNAIWKVDNSRNFFRKTTDYTAIVVLVPLAIIISNIVSAYINIKIIEWATGGYTLGIFSRLGVFLLRYTALITMCFLLSVIYTIIPNTKVKLSSAFLSGIFAGLATHVLQTVFLRSQYFIISYNAIYGSFSIIPIFLIFQRFFWNIILMGCHMSFISQNFYRYDYSLSPIKLSNREQKNISLMIMYLIIINFYNNEPALTTSQLAHKLKLSINLTLSLLRKLLKLGLINKIEDENEEIKYQPAFDISLMNINFIEEKLEFYGKNNVLEFKEDYELDIIYQKIKEYSKEKKEIKLYEL